MAIQIITREQQRLERPKWGFNDNFDLRQHFRKVSQPGNGIAYEFIGTGNFAAEWYERQRYEVDAGRDEEPVLYTPLYDIIEDPSLPRNVTVNRLGPGQVIFSVVEEGGEVKFVTIGESNFSVPIYHYAAGLEYNKDLVIFNELWSVAPVERQAGVAYNALLNHLHLNPFLAHSYGADNQTAGSSLTFDSNASLPEKYLRTLEAAVTHAVADATNPRRGPYYLLMNTGNLFTMERALTVVAQQGITLQSSVMNRIRGIIAYDGWTGRRGNKTVSYGGVSSGKAYLVDVGDRSRNSRSFVKQGLQPTMGNPDVSRFVLDQTVWDAYLGNYADVAATTEEITLPT